MTINSRKKKKKNCCIASAYSVLRSLFLLSYLDGMDELGQVALLLVLIHFLLTSEKLAKK